MITVSAPCKVHLLGEWSVVWGKPALLASVDLRITATIFSSSSVIASEAKQSSSGKEIASSKTPRNDDIKKIIEPIVKKELKLKKIPSYSLKIESDIPMGAHLGSSAAVSVVYIAALLLYLKSQNVILNLFQDPSEMPKQVRHDDKQLDLDLINKLAYEAEKIFHGNPSGADNSTVTYGGLMWYRKETPNLKIIQKLPFSIPPKLSKNFVLINTGTPTVNTRQMIDRISSKIKVQGAKFKKIFDNQEQLTRELLSAIKNADEKEVLRIIREGEKNLESIGVCSPEVKKIIRSIEKAGGAAKICGAGAFSGPTGVLLAFHQNQKNLLKLVKSLNLPYFKVKLGVEGLKLK